MVARRPFGRGWTLAGQPGSAVVFALFACLVACTAAQMLTAAVICGHRAMAEETVGREFLAVRDECLVELKEQAGSEWGPLESTVLEVGGRELPARIAAGTEGDEWVLNAEVDEQTGGSLSRTSVVIERGRDGLDLPIAALVADRVYAEPTRDNPWLVVTDGTACAYVREVQGVAAVGEGCVVLGLESTWALEEGWRNLLAEPGAWDRDCAIAVAEAGLVIGAPNEIGNTSGDRPMLLVVSGGASLDLRGLGEVWATVIVDEGSLRMEGTVVHGAVCATGDVDLGASGQVVYEERVLQWARERSITRTRLVPGSRREVVE